MLTPTRIDIANPASPEAAGSIDTPGRTHGVDVSGGYAYLVDGQHGLQVIDVSNPASPEIVGSVDTPGTPHCVVVSGTHAYVLDEQTGMQVIDITNPASPQIVGSVDTQYRASGVAISGTHAYVADGMAGVQVADITNPFCPEIVGSVDTPGWAYALHVTGIHAYVAADDTGMWIVPLQCGMSASSAGDDRAGGSLVLEACPNPGSPRTTLHVSTRTEGEIHAAIHDIAGRRVRVLFTGFLAAGVHQIVWDGRIDGGLEAPSGIYLARVSTPGGSATARITLARWPDRLLLGLLRDSLVE